MRRADAALIAAGAAARAAALTRPSLWTDEASTLALAREPLAALPAAVRAFEAAPPAHFALMRGWLELFPDAKLGLRSFSWLCGAASLALFARLARALGLRHPALALALCVLSSFWTHAAQDGRAYALLLALGLSTSVLAWELSRAWSWPRAALYGALAALGVLTHHAFALFMAGDLVFALAAGPRRARWLAAWALPAAAALAWIPAARDQVGTWTSITLLKEPLTLRQLASVTGQMIVDAGYLGLVLQPASRALGVLALAGAAWGAVRLRREASAPRRRALLFALAHLAAPLAAARAAELALGVSLAQARYHILVSPFLFLLLADLAPERGPRRAWAAAALAAVFAAGLGLYHWSRIALDPRLDLLARAARTAPEGAPVVHLHAFYYLPLRYYYLPERSHRLVELGGQPMDVSKLPGYPGRLAPGELERLGPCVVVDPERRLFERKLGFATGAELAARLK